MTKAEKTKAYNRTKRGLVRRLYNHQLERCKSRKHELPTYSRDELEKWLYEQPNFNILYTEWVDSSYLKGLKPSVDRINDYTSYTISNIQLTTWEQNNSKARADTKSGKLHKATRQISQYTKQGDMITTYPSIAIAARRTGSNSKAISECLSGRIKTSNNFIWKYTSGELANSTTISRDTH